MTRNRGEKVAGTSMEMNAQKGKKSATQTSGKRGVRLYAPPGMSLWRERATFWILLAAAISYSFRFFSTLGYHLERLYARIEQYGNWDVDVQMDMTDLSILLEGRFTLFGVVILFCLIAIGSRYRYYHKESKSVYLMRRLPDRAQWHRSCLVQPLLRVMLVLVVMSVLLLIFYTVYMNLVPEEYLEPNQWQKLWRWIL